MKSLDNISDKYENLDYDTIVEGKNYRGPEVVFGLTYDFIQPDESLLDIGIGTGKASIPFYKAGLKISGIDLSLSMLNVCRRKSFTENLKCHDLMNAPYPFKDNSMHHIISVGVLNHIDDLIVIFSEAARILKQNGTFSFMVGTDKPAQNSCNDNKLNCQQSSMYIHNSNYINTLLDNCGFEHLKSVLFTVPHGNTGDISIPVKAYVVRNKEK